MEVSFHSLEMEFSAVSMMTATFLPVTALGPVVGPSHWVWAPVRLAERSIASWIKA